MVAAAPEEVELEAAVALDEPEEVLEAVADDELELTAATKVVGSM